MTSRSKFLLALISASLDDRRDETDAMTAFHQTRNALSIGLFDAADALASHAWTSETAEPFVRAMSAAMSDEVTMLAAREAGRGIALASAV